MANKERAESLERAEVLGLIKGTDYQSNISTRNLLVLIANREEEIANSLRGNETYSRELTPEFKQLIEEEPETYDDEMLIVRLSPCGNYHVNIKGIKEAARRTPGTTEDEIKEAIKSGTSANSWKFKEKIKQCR